MATELAGGDWLVRVYRAVGIANNISKMVQLTVGLPNLRANNTSGDRTWGELIDPGVIKAEPGVEWEKGETLIWTNLPRFSRD